MLTEAATDTKYIEVESEKWKLIADDLEHLVRVGVTFNN